jgi:hypothetical protein
LWSGASPVQWLVKIPCRRVGAHGAAPPAPACTPPP